MAKAKHVVGVSKKHYHDNSRKKWLEQRINLQTKIAQYADNLNIILLERLLLFARMTLGSATGKLSDAELTRYAVITRVLLEKDIETLYRVYDLTMLGFGASAKKRRRKEE